MSKKKIAEFSKKIVVISWICTIVWITWSYILATLQIDSNVDATVALVTESFAVTGLYFLYQYFMKNSRNKYKVDSDGIPWKFKDKLSDLTGEDHYVNYDSEESDIEICRRNEK